MRTPCASPDLTVLHRDGAVRVPGRLGISYADIARARPMPDHAASSFEREKGETSTLSFKTVPWLPASRFDPRPIVRAPSISRGAATMSDVVRGPSRRGRGEKASWREGLRAAVFSHSDEIDGPIGRAFSRSRLFSVGFGGGGHPDPPRSLAPRGLFSPRPSTSAPVSSRGVFSRTGIAVRARPRPRPRAGSRRAGGPRRAARRSCPSRRARPTARGCRASV